MPTYYRCSGYVEEICGGCKGGNSHEKTEKCEIWEYCLTAGKDVICEEYDRDPCGDPTCPDCTGGDGASCGNS